MRNSCFDKMSRILVVALACVALLHFASGTERQDPGEQFELREGKCDKAVGGDLVFTDHVHLSRLPFVTRTGTSTWFGDETIYCILALSAKEESKGSTVFVKEGGLNHTFITLEMHSTVNHGLEYNIQVYAKLKR